MERDIKISSSLDWQSVRSNLSVSKNNLKMFQKDINRMLTAIDLEVSKLANLEIIARNKKSPSSLGRVKEQIDVVNKQIKNFNKLYLIALMTHS